MPQLNILHTVPSLVPETGGPPRSVPGLCGALTEQGHAVHLMASDFGDAYDAPLIPPAPVTTELVPKGIGKGLMTVWEPHLPRHLNQAIQTRSIDILHNHSLWMTFNHLAVKAAQRHNIPYVVCTRGTVSTWALSQSRWKKQLAWRLFQRRDLELASVIHATAVEEAEAIRELGLRNPIAIVPNGVTVPDCLPEVAPEKRKRQILFLSRIHPKKGLLNLVKAAATLPSDDSWEIVIAGPDEIGHQPVVEAEVAKYQLQDKFRFIGAIDDGDKWTHYQAADLFILPTHSENFGIVIAEALAAGTPAITTTGAPWQELESWQCGWWVEKSAEAIATALQTALSCSDAELQAMGKRGRDLIIKKYSWHSIGEQMSQVYAWMLGQTSTPPNCIYL